MAMTLGDALDQKARFYALKASRALNYPLLPPRLVALFLTSRCNLRCLMCDIPQKAKSDEISTEQVFDIMQDLSDFGVKELDITGGEPFLRKDILPIIKRAKSLGFRVNITTNGVLIDTNEKVQQLVDTGLDSIQVSIDGAKAETHDYIRRSPGCLEKILNFVEMLNEARALNNGLPHLNCTTVMMRYNLGELLELVHITRELGFTSITLQPIADDNNDIKIRDPSNPHRIRPEQIKQLRGVIDELKSFKRSEGFLCNSERHLDLIYRYFANEELGEITCYSGFFTGTVDDKGILRSVCMGAYGSLLEHSISELWNSKRAQTIRRAIKNCKTPCLYPCWIDFIV